MIATKLKNSPQNLMRLAIETCSPTTVQLIATEIDDCETVEERVEWIMEACATHEQEYMIVIDNETNTLCLIPTIEDENGDITEYLDLWNASKVRDWNE